jgi:hypothetical protein
MSGWVGSEAKMAEMERDLEVLSIEGFESFPELDELKQMYKEKLLSLYCRDEAISCCAQSFKEYNDGIRKSIDVKVEGIWIEIIPPLDHYLQYSHSVSPKAMKIYSPITYARHFRNGMSA